MRRAGLCLLLSLGAAHGSEPDDATISGIITEHGSFPVSDGYHLRTFLTRPEGVDGALPAVHFIQWLSCDSVAIGDGNDGWTQMLRGLVTGGRYAVLRIDKAGVGGSEGPDCSQLDYDTELRHHREAHEWLRSLPGIDRSRIAVVGASMGATMAPLIAADQPVAAVAIWGGGAVTWFERLLAFDRNALELGGRAPGEIAAAMARRAAFYNEYLLKGRTPAEIARADAALGSVWADIIGTDGATHYGRPVAFHHQAQHANWQGAWSRVEAPVLVLYGEHDWFETARSHQSIVRAVNSRPASFHVIPGMDHHFAIYPDAAAAFAEQGGRPDAGPMLDRLLPWLNEVLRTAPEQAAINNPRLRSAP